nr:hypothetical protein [Tanacetum cinerariifolium]
MLNAVRLQEEEESEMSLELLRFTRQQYQDAVRSLKKNTKCFNAAGEELSAVNHKLMLLDTVAERRLIKGVVIRDLEEKSTAIIPAETKSKDKGKGIMVEEPKPIKKKDQVKLDEEYARKLHEKLNKDIDWDMAIEHMKQKDKEDSSVQRYQFLLKSKEQIEEEENRAIKSINETLAQKATKRRKLNEEVKEIKDLKQHLEIVPNEDNDVYTEATPLARKTRRTIANLKESKECTWSCKALELMLPWSLKKNTKCFNAVGEELSDVKHKLMLLDTVVKRRLMLMSQDKTVNKNCSR